MPIFTKDTRTNCLQVLHEAQKGIATLATAKSKNLRTAENKAALDAIAQAVLDLQAIIRASY